jgi:hypothetical protein
MLSELRGSNSLGSNSRVGLNESQDAVESMVNCPAESGMRIFHSSFHFTFVVLMLRSANPMKYDKWQMMHGKRDVHSVRRSRPQIQATRIEIAYSANIGAANSNMLGTSFVGDKTAATIKITITAVRQTRNIQPAVINPIRAKM